MTGDSRQKLILSIQLQPNASRNEIVGYHGEYLKVRVKAPAKEGKANQELIKFLAQHFNVPKTQVTILKGLQTRHKLLSIQGLKLSSPFV